MVVRSCVLHSLKTVRSSFQISDKTSLRWFPGHMYKGLKDMQGKLKDVDCVIEVHDARIPFSGRNPNFRDTVSGLRPHILVLNKVDLSDPILLGETANKINKETNAQVIFANSTDLHCKGILQLIKTLQDIRYSNRYNRNDEHDICAMVIGVPNVGKSSLINRLRNRFLKKSKAVSVGPIAGITRSVGTKVKICENPLIYIYDTPGILTPTIENIDVGMKLALCSTFKDSGVGVINIADYLLYWLNKHNHYSYTSYLNLKEPTDNIIEALAIYAVTYKIFKKKKEVSKGSYVVKPDLDTAASSFINAFRKGTLGLFNLDCDIL